MKLYIFMIMTQGNANWKQESNKFYPNFPSFFFLADNLHIFLHFGFCIH